MTHERDAIRAARELLISLLDSAAMQLPNDAWVVGQRIRFLVDQGDRARALSAVSQCTVSIWWCSALAGFVHHAFGEWNDAERAFRIATNATQGSARCEWEDISALLDTVMLHAYRSSQCSARDSMHGAFWLLADPLLSQSGNDRRVEHYSRRVLVLLRTALPRDERFDWRRAAGGDARALMIMRYGWPSFHFWGGLTEDSLHADRLSRAKPATLGASPYTTYEYAQGRVHLVPTSAAIRNPARATSSDWSLHAPPGRDSSLKQLTPVVRGSFQRMQRAQAYAAQVQHLRTTVIAEYFRHLWWPLEHYAAPRPLLQLPDGQIVLLRRQSAALLAVAMPISNEQLRTRLSSAGSVSLVAASHADSVMVLAQRTWVSPATLVVFGLTPANPGVAGVEVVPTDSTATAARSRFGIIPGPPLSVMRPGEFAVSQPVLLRAGGSRNELPNAPALALELMAGSSEVVVGQKLGVYWEMYGVAPSDSVDIAVWIERLTPQSGLRRFGVSLGIARDLNTPLVVTWSQPQAETGAALIDEGVPILTRSLVLDTANLPTGDYRLEIAVQPAGKSIVRSTRSFAVK